MSAPTLDNAKALIERMKLARPTCDSCERMTVREFLDAGYACGPGLPWEMGLSFSGFINRCDTCRSGQSYPWADQLDAEKVLSFMLEREGQRPGVFDVEDLKVLL